MDRQDHVESICSTAGLGRGVGVTLVLLPGSKDLLPCSGYRPAILPPGHFGQDRQLTGKPDVRSGLFEMVKVVSSLRLKRHF
jgi:hypothetical protein